MGLKGDWVMDFLSSFLLCRRTNQCFILKHCRALTRAQWHAASPWLVLEPEISDRKHEKRMCTMRLFQHQSCASGHLAFEKPSSVPPRSIAYDPEKTSSILLFLPRNATADYSQNRL